MRSGTLAFLGGSCSLYFATQLPPLSCLMGLPILAGLYALLVRIRHPRVGGDPEKVALHYKFAYLGLAFLCGLSWTGLYAHWQMSQRLPKYLETKTIQTQGQIASIPQNKGRMTSFYFDIKRISYKGTSHGESPQGQCFNNSLMGWHRGVPFLGELASQKGTPYDRPPSGQQNLNIGGGTNCQTSMRVKLNWYGQHPKLHVGQRWQLALRLKRPHNMANPAGFDYSAWLFQHHVSAVGYVRKSQANRFLGQSRFAYPITQMRAYLLHKIKNSIENQTTAAFIEALTLGYKNNITPTQWQLFRQTGTSHLLAISGLHIGMVAGIAFFLVGFGWRRCRKLPLTLAAPQAAAIAAILAAVLYSALAGFALPTQRALVMISVLMVTLIGRRHIAAWHGYCVALLLVLLLDPLATLAAGFWLSFAAVGLIIYGVSNRVNPQSLWWKWGRTQWVVGLGLLPLSLALFQQASFVGFIANLFAIPLVGLVIVPLALVGVVCLFLYSKLALILFSLVGILLHFTLNVLAWLSSFAAAHWYMAVPSSLAFISAVIGMLLILAPRGFPNRWLGLFFLLPLLLFRYPTPKFGTFWFTLLDVGQGLATVVQTQHHLLIYDTGPKYSAKFNTGSAVIAPFLRSEGIKRIDKLVISHGDNDHIGGAYALLKQFPVMAIATSVPQRFRHRHASYCLAGEHWQWDGVKFAFLYPVPKLLGQDNNSSCVLRVSTGKHSLLLTGDIEKPAEAYLIKHTPAQKLHADILVAPHHGSKTSSTQAFIQVVKPRYALFAVGYLNRYHFPNLSVVRRYRRDQVALLNTAKAGAIRFTVSPQGISQPRQYRPAHKHYWDQ